VKLKKIIALVMASSYNAHVKNRPTCKEKWTTLYIDYKWIQNYIVGMGHNDFFWNMSSTDKVSMNLFRMSNRSIYEMIDAFMKTRPIFQQLHSKDFMDPTNVVYNPLLHEETESVIVGGEGFLMCEVDLEQDLMYTMFNVDGDMISNPATPQNPIQTRNTRRSYK
jgi:hypothetical protein